MNILANAAIPDIAEQLRLLIRHLHQQKTFGVAGLNLHLYASDMAQIRWVFKYLQPLSLGSVVGNSATSHCYFLHNDDLVSETIQYLKIPGINTYTREGKNRALLTCSRVSKFITIYCDPKSGVVWLTDSRIDTIYVVYSARTPHPSLEFARTVRNVVVEFLEHQGWVSYHAGAVATDQGVLMIIGNSGAGKTSLILALMRNGARYIANERLLVRRESVGFQVLGYPMAIAVGIGTAMQFEYLAPLVESPDELLYPRSRFSKSRVSRTAPDQRQALEDKLQFLPEELARYILSGNAIPGGQVSKVVVPKVRKSADGTSTEVLPASELLAVLKDNYMGLKNDRSHPVWMQKKTPQPDIDVEESSIAALSTVPAVAFRYGLSGPADTTDYLSKILHTG